MVGWGWVGLSLSSRLFALGHADTETDTQSNGKDNENDNSEAPPLELAATARVVGSTGDLLVGALQVADGVQGLVVNLVEDRVLLDDERVEVVKQAVELQDRLLDALQLVMASANSAQDGRSLARAICPELKRLANERRWVNKKNTREVAYSSLEDALAAPIGVRGLGNFLLARVGVDDTVLAGDLLAVALAVLLLLGHVALQLALEVVVEGLELALLQGVGAVGCTLAVALQQTQLVADLGVLELGLGDELLELLGSARVVTAEGALVQAGNGLDARRQGADLAAHVGDLGQVLLLRHDGRACRGFGLAVRLKLMLLLEGRDAVSQLM